MVLKKAVNNLKQGPKEDKVAVASGIAISVVVVLLVAWAIFFFRGLARGSHTIQLGGGVQDEFNFTSVKEAQQALQQDLSNPSNTPPNSSGPVQTEPVQMETAGQQLDQFGTPGSTN